MTNKVIDATNVYGILRVTLTDETVAIRFMFDDETLPEINLLLGIEPITDGKFEGTFKEPKQ